MLLALSSAQKLGIAGIALAFIAFALASSFLLPRSNPDFPGRGLRAFIGVTVLFFVAMMSAVVFLAREEEEAHAEGAVTHVDDSEEDAEGPADTPGFDDEDAPGATTAPGGGGTAGGGQEQGAGGDAEAGKAVYASAGCGGCHTFEPAGSTGTVGPNLDDANTDFAEARQQIENGGNGMPAFKDQLSEKQIADVTAFVTRDGS